MALRMIRPTAELAADSAFRKLLVADTEPTFELAAAITSWRRVW
jgi:hypothetical protein